jgi:hypothetical protein
MDKMQGGKQFYLRPWIEELGLVAPLTDTLLKSVVYHKHFAKDKGLSRIDHAFQSRFTICCINCCRTNTRQYRSNNCQGFLAGMQRNCWTDIGLTLRQSYHSKLYIHVDKNKFPTLRCQISVISYMMLFEFSASYLMLQIIFNCNV